MEGKDIFKLAREGQDHLARKTLNFFLKIYGEYLSNMAISVMPLGGIFLTGASIVSKFLVKLNILK